MNLRQIPAPKLVAVAAAALAAAAMLPPAVAQETSLVSIRADGKQSDRDCIPSAISFDGNTVAFVSDAVKLADLTTHFVQAYVKDRVTGALELVSRNASGTEADADVRDVRLSPDGNFVVFSTAATNLDPTDTNGVSDCYLVDRAAQTIERVSIGPDGELGDGDSFAPIVSADGRYVAFTSWATNFTIDDDNVELDVFLRDRQIYQTWCISLTPEGHVGNGPSIAGDLTSDGNQVVFASEAHDLTDVQTVGADIFVRDVAAAATTLLSLEMDGTPATDCEDPRCSADGSVVCFKSSNPRLVPDDHDNAADVFVLDRVAGTVERANVTSDGAEAGGAEYGRISADGRFIGFSGGPLDPLDTNGVPDGYARDRLRQRTFRIDVHDGGDQSNMVGGPSIPSGDGHAFLFATPVKMVDDGDLNGFADIFVHELAPTRATSSHYGSGFPGELGIPALSLGGDPVIGAPLDLTIGSSSSQWILGFLAIGVTPIDVRGSWGGHLLVAPLQLIPVPVTPFGYTLHGAIPYDAAFWNFVLELQALELDPAAAKGISSTDGLELDFGN